MAPPNFAASKYYALLKQRVGEAYGGDYTSADGNESEGASCQTQLSCASTSSGPSNLDMRLAGQSCTQDVVRTEALGYKSALAILQSTEEGKMCKFQGVVVVCDDAPRDVHISENLSRKRKGAQVVKTLSIVLIDKTGPMRATQQLGAGAGAFGGGRSCALPCGLFEGSHSRCT